MNVARFVIAASTSMMVAQLTGCGTSLDPRVLYARRGHPTLKAFLDIPQDTDISSLPNPDLIRMAWLNKYPIGTTREKIINEIPPTQAVVPPDPFSASESWRWEATDNGLIVESQFPPLSTELFCSALYSISVSFTNGTLTGVEVRVYHFCA